MINFIYLWTIRYPISFLKYKDCSIKAHTRAIKIMIRKIRHLHCGHAQNSHHLRQCTFSSKVASPWIRVRSLFSTVALKSPLKPLQQHRQMENTSPWGLFWPWGIGKSRLEPDPRCTEGAVQPGSAYAREIRSLVAKCEVERSTWCQSIMWLHPKRIRSLSLYALIQRHILTWDKNIWQLNTFISVYVFVLVGMTNDFLSSWGASLLGLMGSNLACLTSKVLFVRVKKE